ncbi:MAG: HEAT repeat domain-containing protein [Candidatus Omnitrophota bacterium]|jgi:HEAT repeat protein
MKFITVGTLFGLSFLICITLCGSVTAAPTWTTYAGYKKIVEDYKRKDTSILLKDLQSKDPMDRQLAALGLGAKGKDGIEPLLALSKSSYFTDRFYAISALSDVYNTTHDERALDAVIGGINDDNIVVALGAAGCLDMDNPKAINSLVVALKDTRKDSGGNSVQDYATDSLVKIGKPSVESLIGALKDKDPQVRYRAVKALGEIKDEKAAASLASLLGDKAIISIRRPDVDTIPDPIAATNEEMRLINLRRTISPTAADDLREYKYASEPLPKAMYHRQSDGIVEGSGILAKNAINWMLKERYYKATIGELSRVALVNMGPSVTENIAPLLESDDSYVRSGAVYVAGGIKAISLTKNVADILINDKDPDVRKIAALALGEMGDSRAAKYLNEAGLTEKRKDVKDAITYSMDKLKNSLPTVVEGN